MARGRAQRTWFDEEGPGPVYLEVVESGTRGRLQIRQPGRGCVNWLDGRKSRPSIVELAETGQLVFRSWQPLGDRIDVAGMRWRQLVSVACHAANYGTIRIDFPSKVQAA